VGDADQAIYGFRGGRVENFLDFRRDFPQATVIVLEENYRSTATIINAAQQVIEKNRQRIDKRLIPTRPPGPAVEIYELPNEQEEALLVAREIENLLGGTRFENTCHAHDEAGAQGFGDIAVLYRLHAQGRVLRTALHDRGLPVQVAASPVLYEQPEVKPIIDFLRALGNPHGDVALSDILTSMVPAIGPATVTKLATEARRQELPLLVFLQQSAALVSGLPRPAADRLASVLDFFRTVEGASATVSLDGLIRQIWNYLYGPAREPSDELLEVMTSAMSFCHLPAAQAIPLFLKKIALAEEGDLLPPSCEAITLMTVHAAKGLEFGFVFLTGLEEGLFPYAPPNHENKPRELEEERRLFYVGMTRARERLYLSWARSRVLYGERRPAMPSAFLDDIPAEISKRNARSIQKKHREPSKQMKLFSL
jgi:DNA helicase-2/ATP-dependent DNA helicase PcrA